MVTKAKKWFAKIIARIYIHKYFPFVIYKPQLHKVKGYQIRKILTNVKVGDLIFRRDKGYLSGKFIPGKYSHVGLCVSNKDIVHSINDKGVIKEDILTFCRTDIIALVRPVSFYSDKDKAVKMAMKLVNKHVKYDYEFKRNNGSVYCTELVNICYEYIFDHDFKKNYGQLVLTPDKLMKSKLNKTILEFNNQ